MMKAVGSNRCMQKLIWCGCALVITAAIARATVVIKFTDEELVRHSRAIVEATVTGVRSEWNVERTQIITYVDLSLKNIYKGTFEDKEHYTFRMLGGRVGDSVMEIVGAPAFAPGEEVILFLAETDTLIPIVGLHQGKLLIETHKHTGEKLIVGKGISREDFLSKIERIINDQAQNKENK